MKLDDGEAQAEALLFIFFAVELEEGPDGLDVFGAEAASLIGYREFADCFGGLGGDGDGGSCGGELERVVCELIGEGNDGVFRSVSGEVIDMEV